MASSSPTDRRRIRVKISNREIDEKYTSDRSSVIVVVSVATTTARTFDEVSLVVVVAELSASGWRETITERRQPPSTDCLGVSLNRSSRSVEKSKHPFSADISNVARGSSGNNTMGWDILGTPKELDDATCADAAQKDKSERNRKVITRLF